MQEVNFEKIQEMVQKDAKGRFHLKSETENGNEAWWIRANQGHSMKVNTMLFGMRAWDSKYATGSQARIASCTLSIRHSNGDRGTWNHTRSLGVNS